MNAVTETTQLDKADVGLFQKFTVTRTDGSSAPGGKHENDQYFPLDLTTDKHALPALAAYAESCATDRPTLAKEIRALLADKMAANSEFVTVPGRTLKDGTVVPSFTVGKYLSSRGAGGIPQSTADGAPWVEIDYHDSVAACKSAGYNLITESQCIALALDIAEQPENWQSGVVGEGKMFQGLHLGTVDEAQPGIYESDDPTERRWFVLSNGERIYDAAGNAYTWVFDDIQGDENGIVKSRFAKDSPSITSAPAPSMAKGVGWYPDSSNWSGYALVRGGCWRSDDYAGAFSLHDDSPGFESGLVGFRLTK